MEFDSIFKREICAYTDKRRDDGVDEPTITEEMRKKWPNVISDEAVAANYIVHCKQRVRPKAT